MEPVVLLASRGALLKLVFFGTGVLQAAILCRPLSSMRAVPVIEVGSSQGHQACMQCRVHAWSWREGHYVCVCRTLLVAAIGNGPIYVHISIGPLLSHSQ